jgi:hypothetical protein
MLCPVAALKASVTRDENGIAIIRTRAVHDHKGNEQKAEVF